MIWTTLKFIKETVETILAFILLIGWGKITLIYLWEPKRNIFLNFSLILISVIGFSLITRLLYKNTKTIRRDFLKQKASEDVRRDAREYNARDLRKLIPQTKTMKEVFGVFHSEALDWSSDCKWLSANLYIHIKGDDVEYSYQGIFWSANKSLSRTQHLYSRHGFIRPSFEEQDSTDRIVDKPLFIKYRRWRKAVIKAVESQIDRSDDRMDIAIQQSFDDFGINMTLYLGKIEQRVSYRYDGKILKNQKTGQIINL